MLHYEDLIKMVYLTFKSWEKWAGLSGWAIMQKVMHAAFLSLMTFLQSNSKQAWKRDDNIGLFVIFILTAELTRVLFVFPL